MRIRGNAPGVLLLATLLPAALAEPAARAQASGSATAVVASAAPVAAADTVAMDDEEASTSGLRGEWEQRFGPFEELLAEHPALPANETAEHLERLAASLGIDLVPHSRRARGELGRRSAHRPWEAWLEAAVSMRDPSGRPSPPEPPEELEALLAHGADALAQVRHVLIRWEPPRWESELGELSAPGPNLLGQLDLARLLIADALVAHLEGDARHADEGLRAAWVLAQALSSRAELVSAWMAVALARRVLDALRVVVAADVNGLGDASGSGDAYGVGDANGMDGTIVDRRASGVRARAWLEALDAAPFRDAMLDGMRHEALGWIVVSETGNAFPPREPAGLLDRIERALDRRLTRIAAGRAALELLPVAERLERPEACGPPEPPDRGLLGDVRILRRAFDRPHAARGMGIHLVRDWSAPVSLDRLALEIELTRLQLALAEAVSAGEPLVPCGVIGPGGEGTAERSELAPCPSSACPEVTWLFERDDDMVSIRASGIDWKDDGPSPLDSLPLEAVAHVRGGPAAEPGVLPR